MDKNDELNKKIEDAIKDSMPSKVGDELKKLLEQGKSDAAKVIQLTNQNIDLSKTISTLNEKLTNYAKLDERNATLEAREKKVAEDERQIELKTLQYQLEAEKAKTEFTKNVALGLVRNTEYRRKLFDNINEPNGKDQYGNQVYHNKSQSSDETNEAK
jgi:hypothetical protein